MSIDMSVAFDCVEHQLLLEKLQFYSLGEGVIKWIQSYLEFRTIYVSIGGGDSAMIPVVHGIPQGSVLGPLLYILYVNNFCLQSMTTFAPILPTRTQDSSLAVTAEVE